MALCTFNVNNVSYTLKLYLQHSCFKHYYLLLGYNFTGSYLHECNIIHRWPYYYAIIYIDWELS